MREDGQAGPSTQLYAVFSSKNGPWVYDGLWSLHLINLASINTGARRILVRKIENVTFVYLHQLPFRREDGDGAVVHSSLGGMKGQEHHQNS